MTEKELYELLLPRYGANLKAKEASKVMGKSPSTLYRMRTRKTGPSYIKDEENGENSAIRYPLHEIVQYLCKMNDIKEFENE